MWNGTGHRPGEAGPSRPRPPQPPIQDEFDDHTETSQPTAKRPRIIRSGKACHSCRIRKRKCGGSPPGPCPNCIKGGNDCSWPLEDGRSSAARKNKASMAQGVRWSYDLPDDPLSWMSDAGEDWFTSLGDLGTDNTHQTQTSFSLPLYDPPSMNPAILSLPNTLPPAHTPYPPPAPDSYPLGSVNPVPNMGDQEWPADFDPFEFIMAMSSRMPMVESAAGQDTSPGTDPPSASAYPNDPPGKQDSNGEKREKGKVVKVTWWRPHGQTAIAPGLKKMTLKVRLHDETRGDPSHRSPSITSSSVGPIELFDSSRAPHPVIMRHLMGLFRDQFGSQFPSVDCARLLTELEAGDGSVFLLNCIAAVSARFSSHPSIALSHLRPYEYGNVFYSVAKDMLGSMLSLPSRETIIALLILSHVGFANDSEAEEWMFCGMAVRLAVDLGLHLQPGDEHAISAEDRRLDRLVFWSVILLDFSLSFGTGRQPTLRVDEITQSLPTDEDMPAPQSLAAIHPFPYAAKMMFSYGRLIELLNTRQEDHDGSIQKEIQRQRLQSIQEYGSLPPDVRWNASGFMTGTDYARRNTARPPVVPGGAGGAVTPGGMAAATVWRNSARTIGDILVLSDIVCPIAYAALPFVNQAFYVAGSCYVKELEQERQAQLAGSEEDTGVEDGHVRPSAPVKSEPSSRDEPASSSDLFKSILATVSTENIEVLRKGLAKQADYWSGVRWVAAVLEQRIEGIAQEKIDLEEVTGKLITIASVPDAGLLRRSRQVAGDCTDEEDMNGS